jgi:hypothetical protein
VSESQKEKGRITKEKMVIRVRPTVGGHLNSALRFCSQRNVVRDKLAQVQLLTRMVDVDSD